MRGPSGAKDLAAYPAYVARAATAAPFFGPYLAWGAVGVRRLAGTANVEPSSGVRPRGLQPSSLQGRLVARRRRARGRSPCRASCTGCSSHGTALTMYYYNVCSRPRPVVLVIGALPAVGTVCTD